MAKRALLVAGENNILSGKQLQDMGRYVTSDGYLIAATLKYDVWLYPGKWDVRLHIPINTKTKKNVRKAKGVKK